MVLVPRYTRCLTDLRYISGSASAAKRMMKKFFDPMKPLIMVLVWRYGVSVELWC
jgi:hypothetical protein